MPTPREAFTNSVERQGPSGARVRAADFGAAGETIGRAAAGFGQDMSKAADNIRQMQERDAETAAREADNIRTAKRLKRMYGEDGYFNKQGRNALEDQPQLEADLKAIDDEAGAMLANKPLAQRMYGQLTLKRNNDDMPSIWKHSAKARNDYEDQVDTDAFDLAVDNAATSTSPIVREENLDTLGQIAERAAIRKGLGNPNDPKDNTLRQVRQSAIGKGVAAIADRLERTVGPAEALAFVTTRTDIDPEDQAKLMKGLEGGAAEERAETDISSFEVMKGGYAPVAATEGAAPAVAGVTQMPPEAALAAAQWAQESGGVHRNADGSFVTSSAGARGVSQVMPKTGVDPGYGVKPLQNTSREEYIRFGNDLRRAYTKEFGGSVVLGLIAYNWGPGNLKSHIKKVGDPTKGQISEAAFVNSIPVEEAREYAPKILNRVGVSIAGAPGPVATGAVPPPVGQETDIIATINNINASDRTWADKKALIAVANRRHSYGKQAKAELEAGLKDELYTEINKLPVDGFTNVNQLPLSLRNRIGSHPELFNTARNMADANADRKAAEFDAARKERYENQLAVLEQDLMAVMWSDPARFQKIDFYNSPAWAKMGTAKVTEWMKRQQASIESGAGKGADHNSIRTMVNRYTTEQMKKDPKKMGLINSTVITLEERALNAPGRGGKPLTDTEREALVMEATTQATYTDREGNERTGTRAEAAAAGARTSQVNIYDNARVQLQKRWGRVPLPHEVERAVQALRAREGR